MLLSQVRATWGGGWPCAPLGWATVSSATTWTKYHRRGQQIAAGHSCLEDLTFGRRRAVLDFGSCNVTADAAALAGFDIAVIIVPTPLRDGVPDLTYAESCLCRVAEYLRPGTTVVLESTTCPGTIEARSASGPDTGRSERCGAVGG